MVDYTIIKLLIEITIKGITELRYIDPRKIKKIREIKKGRLLLLQIYRLYDYNEYFYTMKKVLQDLVWQVVVLRFARRYSFYASGLVDLNKNMVMGYLHKAIKPVNQLRMIEDACCYLQNCKSTERRIFKIDVGNLPKVKAEQYRDVMARYRNKLVYDASTGEIRDDRNYMSMLKTFGY